MKNRRLSLFVILIVLFTILFFNESCKKSNKTKIIKIYGNLPLTGPISLFSGRYPLGFKLGLEDACKKFNVNLDTFKVDFQDNQGKSTAATYVMRKQLFSHPDIYISGTSQMSEAVIPEISKLNIPHFLVSFEETLAIKYPNTFIILPNFKLEAPLFVKFIISNNAKRVFLFTPNLKAYLHQYDTYIIPEIKKHNINYHRELFEFNQKDFHSIVLKAIEYNPDVIIVSGYAFHLFPILKLLKQYNMEKKSKIMATLDYIDLISDQMKNNSISGMAFTSPLCEIPGKTENFQIWKNFFSQKFGKTPTYVDAYAYDTAQILVKAYKTYGKIDNKSIIKVIPFNGIVGRITVDKYGILNSTLTIGFFSEDKKIQEWTPEVYK